MNPFTKLMQGLTGTGAHRAADRIPQLETDRDYWRGLALEARAKLAHADQLITKVCAEKSAALVEIARLRGELDVQIEGHQLLGNDFDELAARFTEVSAQLANARAVSAPAPADHRPAITIRDPDSTVETNVTTLWNGLGLRPNKQTAA